MSSRGITAREIAGIAEALATSCRRLHARGLLAGAEGNCSVRLADGSMLITASGIDKATIGPQHVLRRHADGGEYHNDGASGVPRDTVAGDSGLRPSSEMQMHCALYAERSDVMAVVHAHPPAATGFATAGRAIPADVLPEVPVVVGPVALVPYGRPGTSALPDAIRPFAAHHEVFLLANHGVTAVGRSLVDALTRMESIEQAARILVVAELLGGARVLPEGEPAALAALRPLPSAASPVPISAPLVSSTDVLS